MNRRITTRMHSLIQTNKMITSSLVELCWHLWRNKTREMWIVVTKLDCTWRKNQNDWLNVMIHFYMFLKCHWFKVVTCISTNQSCIHHYYEHEHSIFNLTPQYPLLINHIDCCYHKSLFPYSFTPSLNSFFIWYNSHSQM